MGDHPNATLVRQAMEAFMEGQQEALADLIADDVVWHQIGEASLRGKDAVMQAMTGLGGGAEFSGGLHDVVANDEHVIALVETNVRAGGREMSYRTAEVMHIEDGKVTERWSMSDDTEAIKDFFGRLGG